MKFSVLNPTEENIRETLLNDQLGRNEELRQFVRLLNSIDGNCTIALDGDWGSGKTFFVKQAQMIIDSFNEYKNKKAIPEKDEENIKIVKDKFDDLGIKLQATAYYDAWENDNEDDPLLSILFSIINTVDCDKDFFKQDKPTALLKAIANAITTKAFSIPSKDLLEALSGVDIFKELKQHKTLRENVTEFLNELIPVGSKRLVIFIDELDRCKPSYAVKMLERIKHFFSNENIIFVFAINSFELQNTIKQYYGSSFNAYQYLERFFDLRIKLKDVDINKFIELRGLWNYAPNEIAIDNINEIKAAYVAFERIIIRHFDFKMRSIERFLKQLKMVRNISISAMYAKETQTKEIEFFNIFIPPMLVALNIYSINLYRDFINGKDSKQFVDVLLKCIQNRYLKQRLIDLISKNYAPFNKKELTEEFLYDSEPKKNTYAAAFEDVYDVIFKDNNGLNFPIIVGKYEFNSTIAKCLDVCINILSQVCNFE